MRFAVTSLIFVSAIASTAHSQSASDLRRFNQDQYSGWSGVVLRCRESDSSSQEIADYICNRASAEFRHLAEVAKLPHRVSRNENQYSLTVNNYELGTPLMLQLDTNSAGYQNQTAVSVHLSARKFYSGAIEIDAAKDGPTGSPRSGELSLWDTNIIGIGDHGIANAMAIQVNDQIKVFLTEFLQGWNVDSTIPN